MAFVRWRRSFFSTPLLLLCPSLLFFSGKSKESRRRSRAVKNDISVSTLTPAPTRTHTHIRTYARTHARTHARACECTQLKPRAGSRTSGKTKDSPGVFALHSLCGPCSLHFRRRLPSLHVGSTPNAQMN